MAKYQREFLVTYLRDASALHFALHKLQERLIALDDQRRSLEKGIHRKDLPIPPRYEASNGAFLLFLGVLAFVTAFSVMICHLYFIGCFGILIGVMSIIIGAMRYVRITQENNRKESAYNQKLAAYMDVQTKNEQERKAIPNIIEEMHQCQLEIERTWDTLRNVYRANVVPKGCRNIYATVFLYVWFSEDNLNDMEMAINTFQFEKTKEKLDLLLFCQKEILLNRYLQQQETPAVMPEGMLDQMDVSDEERNAYLAMIESNTMTTTYFATADYLAQI